MKEDCQLVIDLVKKLGDGLLAEAGKIEDIGVKKQWLTENDIKIEKALTKLVKGFEGEHKVYGEELHEEFLNADNVWVIDPISHTFNFLHGLPHYAVVVSHMKKGEIVFSIVYDPSMRESFVAYKGEGAYLNGERIEVKTQDVSRAVLFDHGHQGLDDFISAQERIFSFGRIKTLGSLGLHYAYVACGRAQAAVSLNKDTFPEFAGKLLVEEAGGVFLDFDGDQLKTDTRGVIAASNEALYQEVRESLEGFRY